MDNLVPHCDHSPRSLHTLPSPKVIAKDIGTFSIAGTQPKVVATVITEVAVCDDCWASIEAYQSEMITWRE
jgi:hypothetical protein